MTERITTPETTSRIVDEAIESVGSALEQYFNFLPLHKNLKNIPPLRRKINALAKSLEPFQTPPGSYQNILDRTETEPLFDSVKGQVIIKYESQVSTKIAATDPPKHLSGEEIKAISQFLLQQLAQTAAQAVCFALQRERISYRLNPYGILLQIHNLGAWRAGFYEDFDEKEKFFSFFPLFLEARHQLAFFRFGPGKEISWAPCDIRSINNQELSEFYPFLTRLKT